MEHQDRVYGKVEITEPVILELINSPELQRLKEIDQAGYFEPYSPGSSQTRFEHSVGCYILLNKFGASLEEQIAGLIHDVSHSAFSHSVDYALSEGSEKEQNHQDNYFEEYVFKSGIPAILKKYGLDVDYVIHESNFPLQETLLPDLCADRIDYSFRGMLAYKISFDRIGHIMENMTAQDGKWVFKDFDSAYEYANIFFRLNTDYYAAIETAVMFRRVGDYLKHALDKEYISKEDLYSTDRQVIEKTNKHLPEDEKLNIFWKRMNNGAGFENNPNDFDVEVYVKSRIVDPLCWHEEKIKRVSDIKPEWKGVVEKESKPKQYFIKFSD
jgi:hypothetical protein